MRTLKGFVYHSLLLLTFFLTANAAFAGRFVASPPDAIPNRWLVMLEDSPRAVREEAEEILGQFPGKRPLQIFEHAARGFTVEMTPQAARALSRNPHVALVEQDRLVQVQAPACPTVLFTSPSTFPTSPQSISCPVFYADNGCNDNWGLDRIDQQNQPLNGLFSFGGNTGAGVHMYFLDTGIDYAGSEFKNAQGVSRVGTSINFGGNGSSTTNPYATTVSPTNYYDGYGHGTHVAAIAAGLRFGVAKSATIHAVRITNNAAASSTALITQGVDWIAQNHVKPAVVNISLNFKVASPNQDVNSLNVMETAFRNLVNVSGVTVVNSAGNFNQDAYDFSPSRLSELIVVGASDYYDGRWQEAPAFEPCNIRPDPYSQCGSNFGTSVDLWAPGAFITSAWPGGGICRQTGTSMAAPLTAGVVATYLQTHPTALPSAVATALINNASSNVLNSSTLGSAGTPNKLLRTFP